MWKNFSWLFYTLSRIHIITRYTSIPSKIPVIIPVIVTPPFFVNIFIFFSSNISKQMEDNLYKISLTTEEIDKIQNKINQRMLLLALELQKKLSNLLKKPMV